MKNDYQKGMIAGAIAGVVSGIICAILGSISLLIGFFEYVELPIGNFFANTIILTIIFGVIFGLIYAQFYSSIPNTGLMKGLYFGFIIWLIKDIAAGAYSAFVIGQIVVAVYIIVAGVYMWPIYGLVLEYFYKK